MMPNIPDLVEWGQISGVAILCGFIVGLERQISGKPAGIRTSVLICLGCAYFITLAQLTSPDSAAHGRVLGQLATGIGFLGAGVIINTKYQVIGMTSASVIWILATIGAAIGFQLYYHAVATALLTVALLFLIHKLETRFKIFRKGNHAVVHKDMEIPK
jgi:putative Mg2+ transporter-C (MgtC) family protein